MKKKLTLILILVLALSLAACSGKGKVEEPPKDEEQVEVTEDEKEEVIEEVVEEEEEVEETEEPEEQEVSKGEENYANLDDRWFSIDGVKYIIGETTLQELVDNGVKLKGSDADNLNNNVQANSISQPFRIDLEVDGVYSVQVRSGNFGDSGKPASELPITEFYWAIDKDNPQSRLSVGLPMDITVDEMIAKAGEPTDRRDFTPEDDPDYLAVTLNYQIDSDVYLGQSGYKYEFINDVLRYVNIDLK